MASPLPIAIIQHSPNVPTGLLGEYLTENNIAFTVVKVFEGDKLPNASSYSAIVSLGGIMGAYEEAEYPWIADEKKWLKENTDKGVPILGICLGCQLLADALGGKAYIAEGGHEVGFPTIHVLETAEVDEVFKHVPKTTDGNVNYTLCHGDTWDLPPGAILLAQSDFAPQAFRFGSALAVQFHPEANARIFENWQTGVYDRYMAQNKPLPPHFQDKTTALQFANDNAAELKAAAFALFKGWTDTFWKK